MPGGNSGVRVRYTVPVGGGRSPLSLDREAAALICSLSGQQHFGIAPLLRHGAHSRASRDER